MSRTRWGNGGGLTERWGYHEQDPADVRGGPQATDPVPRGRQSDLPQHRGKIPAFQQERRARGSVLGSDQVALLDSHRELPFARKLPVAPRFFNAVPHHTIDPEGNGNVAVRFTC